MVIFISKFDMFKEGKMYYKINRVIEASGTVVYNGMSEYYVNAAVKDRSTEAMSDITDLMEIFVDSDKYDYKKFPKTSERKNQFKNTEEGLRAMNDGIQALIDKEVRKEVRKKEQETLVTSIRNVMESLGVTIEKAMDFLKIPQADRATYAGLVQEKF